MSEFKDTRVVLNAHTIPLPVQQMIRRRVGDVARRNRGISIGMLAARLFVFLVIIEWTAAPVVRADAPPIDTTPSTPVPYLSPEELRTAVPQALANRSRWHLSASHNPGTAQLAVDGDMNTRYDTGCYQAPGEWFQIELPEETHVNALELDAGASAYDYPRGYKVQLSVDGQHWGEPVASGLGKKTRTEIEFEPANVRFIRITQTGAEEGVYWSIHEMKIYQTGR